MKIEPCPEGHEAKLEAVPSKYWLVKCDWLCWVGPSCFNKEIAIEKWNKWAKGKKKE